MFPKMCNFTLTVVNFCIIINILEFAAKSTMTKHNVRNTCKSDFVGPSTSLVPYLLPFIRHSSCSGLSHKLPPGSIIYRCHHVSGTVSLWCPALTCRGTLSEHQWRSSRYYGYGSEKRGCQRLPSSKTW